MYIIYIACTGYIYIYIYVQQPFYDVRFFLSMGKGGNLTLTLAEFLPLALGMYYCYVG